jgi:outer membrane protein OmpA-like peptidoglycan-associated protein
MLVGLSAGYLTGWQSATIPIVAASGDCGTFGSGTTGGTIYEASALFPSLLSDRLGLSFLLGLHNSSASFTAGGDTVALMNPDGLGTVLIPQESRLRIDARALRVGVLAHYDLGSRFAISGGPIAAFQFSQSSSQTVARLGDYRFPDGRDEVPDTLGTRFSTRPFSFGIALSPSVSIPLGRGLSASGFGLVQFDLLSPVSQASWYTTSIGGGVRLQYVVAAAPEASIAMAPPPPLPPVVPPSQPTVQEPSSSTTESPASMVAPPDRHAIKADVDLYAVNDQGTQLPVATVQIFEVLRRQRSPFLPAVSFGRRSAELPAQYVQYTREQAAGLPVDSLTGLDPTSGENQALNVLGARLARYQNAHVTLYGGRSSDEPATLATARAERVRSYLEEVWRIDRSRIALGEALPHGANHSGGGKSEARRVLALSDSPELSQPVTSERIERDFDPPLLKIVPRISASDGVKRWTIALQNDGVEIARYSNDQPQGAGEHINWQIENASEAPAASSLVAVLTVEDSLGKSATAHGRTPLTIQRNARIVDSFVASGGSASSTAYTLFPFDDNSVELSKRNQMVVEEIAQEIRSGARVNISGNSDRTGKGEFNSGLAGARADQIAGELRSLLKRRKVQNVAITITPRGSATSRFDNDLPEGHRLSRAVEVVVEQAN